MDKDECMTKAYKYNQILNEWSHIRYILYFQHSYKTMSRVKIVSR